MSSSKPEFELVWDSWNKDHIKKHNVSVAEVKQACKARVHLQKSYLGRKLLLGRTRKGRLLTVVLSFGKQMEAYVVSARDMSLKERRIYGEKTKTN